MQNNDNLSALELQARILNLKKELDQKSKIEMMAALESSQQPANFNYLISYQGNRFSYLDKNQLIAVIIGALLILVASRLLYEN